MNWISWFQLVRRSAPAAVLGLFMCWRAAEASGADRTLGIWTNIPDSLAASDTLSFAHALTRVKRTNPVLRSLGVRTEGGRALVDQAGARPNPGVSFEAENIGGDYSGFARAELSLRLEQEVELGGKRSKRVEAAERAFDEISRDATTQAFDLFLEARARYADVLHAEEQLHLALAADTVVAALAKSAEDRVRSGATLIADASIAAVARVRSRTAIDDAVANRFRTRVALSILWGDADGFDEPVTLFPSAVPRRELSADSAFAWAAVSPTVRRLELATATLRAEANLQRGLRVPNIVFGGGGRRIEGDDTQTFLFDVALPLPLWDRRDGAIRAADAQVRASEYTVTRARSEVAGSITARISKLARARARLLRAEHELLPALAGALENMRAAYAIGRTSYADLLEVTRAFIELGHDVNDTRRAIVEEQIEIERLTGRTIEELMTDE